MLVDRHQESPPWPTQTNPQTPTADQPPRPPPPHAIPSLTILRSHLPPSPPTQDHPQPRPGVVYFRRNESKLNTLESLPGQVRARMRAGRTAAGSKSTPEQHQDGSDDKGTPDLEQESEPETDLGLEFEGMLECLWVWNKVLRTSVTSATESQFLANLDPALDEFACNSRTSTPAPLVLGKGVPLPKNDTQKSDELESLVKTHLVPLIVQSYRQPADTPRRLRIWARSCLLHANMLLVRKKKTLLFYSFYGLC